MDSIVDFIVVLLKLLIFGSVILGVLLLWGYNKIRRLAENVKETLANISLATRTKIQLVNQLMQVAKDYQKGEQLTMLKVSEDLTVSSVQSANQQSGHVLAAINSTAQRFPELKSDQHYSELMKGIWVAEANLNNARERYNAVAKEYNVTRNSIPHVFYAHLLGFQPAQYLIVEARESADAGIQLSMISDDGEHVNQLLARAGSKVVGAAKSIADQGRMLAEKGAARVQQAPAQTAITDTSVRPEPNPVECQSCGQPLAEGVKFCANCGAPSRAPRPSGESLCAFCGAANSSASRFCQDCGKPLQGEMAATG